MKYVALNLIVLVLMVAPKSDPGPSEGAEKQERAATSKTHSTLPDSAVPPWVVGVRARLAEKDYDRAAKLLEQLVSRHTNDFEVLNLLAATLERAGPAEKATTYYQRALQVLPESTTVRLNLALNYVRLKKYDSASTEFTRLLKEDSLSRLQEPTYQQGPDDDVIGAFVDRIPARQQDWYELGMLLLRHTRIQGAQTVFLKAVRLFPDSARLQYGLGWSLQEGGRFQEAREAFSDALKLQYPFPEAALRLGYGHYIQGEYSDAIRIYEKLLTSQSDSYEAHYFLSQAYAKKSPPELETAAEHLRKAISLNPQSFDSHAELGRIYLEAGMLGSARQELELAVRLNPEEEKAHYFLAQVYLKMAQNALAEKELRTFEELRRQDRLRAREAMNADLLWSREAVTPMLAQKIRHFFEDYKAALLTGNYLRIWQWLTPASRQLYDDDFAQFSSIASRVFENLEVRQLLKQSTLERGRLVAGRIFCEFSAAAGKRIPPLVLLKEGGQWKIDYAFEWTTAGIGYLGAR
ncbi:MAG TPA: tetratricopeptide repeat protein [Acidobacteriota bacterium]|jgi:Flp pilus assembly protein TadD